MREQSDGRSGPDTEIRDGAAASGAAAVRGRVMRGLASELASLATDQMEMLSAL